MCSYRGGGGCIQETYSVRLKKISQIYGRPQISNYRKEKSPKSNVLVGRKNRKISDNWGTSEEVFMLAV